MTESKGFQAGTEIRLVLGDITRITDVEAIVNSATKSLLGGGGVDGAIHRAAGIGLLRECRTLGGCETGEAKITGAYDLPCKYVIHTVGPVWYGGGSKEEALLQDSYRNCLALAEANGIRTIAFPSISTGVFGYPVREAAEAAVKTVRRWLSAHPGAFSLVEWVLFDEKTFEAYEEALACADEETSENEPALTGNVTDIRGRWALVTGAARGIGRGAALFLAGRGCNLVLHGRTAEHCRGTAEAAEALGVETICVGAELSDLDAVRRFLQEVDALGKRIDIVLNNAGVQVAYRTDYLKTPPEDYEQSFLINTIAPMMITYHFLPLMLENGFGRIVNTTSGIRLEPEQAGYSASKAALDKVTTDLASKIDGTDIMLNLTDPGWCRTDLGGPKAPNAPESSLPGVVLGVFMNDQRSGRLFAAPDYHGMSLEEAVDTVLRKS